MTELTGGHCPLRFRYHQPRMDCDMARDPILEEVRRIKEEHAAKYGFDLKKMFAAIKKQEQKSGRKIIQPLTKRKLSA
jgi:hypothetical protein